MLPHLAHARAVTHGPLSAQFHERCVACAVVRAFHCMRALALLQVVFRPVQLEEYDDCIVFSTDKGSFMVRHVPRSLVTLAWTGREGGAVRIVQKATAINVQM
eukprot:537908-Pleurochrysis_carterae.AAC.2